MLLTAAVPVGSCLFYIVSGQPCLTAHSWYVPIHMAVTHIFGVEFVIISMEVGAKLQLGPSCSWGQAAGYQPRPQAGG